MLFEQRLQIDEAVCHSPGASYYYQRNRYPSYTAAVTLGEDFASQLVMGTAWCSVHHSSRSFVHIWEQSIVNVQSRVESFLVLSRCPTSGCCWLGR